MNYRKFGKTDLRVSEIGFGAWAIGGPAMAGEIPIGWGPVSDQQSRDALRSAVDYGINFFDTADFYGLGHSEALLGDTFGNSSEVIIATKVGHRLSDQKEIYVDYGKSHIIEACEQSLQRLKRDSIDFYQLHTAKVHHLLNGECIEAMEDLKKSGKIRYWGLSLNTFAPEPEAEFMMVEKLGNGFQLVLNMINQKALPIIKKAGKEGYGTIVRMPLQFGLLTGKFDPSSRFSKDDHRSFRLTPQILTESISALDNIWPLSKRYGMTPTQFSLSFLLGFKEVSTIIPGMKTKEQVIENTTNLIRLNNKDQELIIAKYKDTFQPIVRSMELAG